ncbi:MAG: hypothetical protein V4537_16225 [Pseudomonadota bacterium]
MHDSEIVGGECAATFPIAGVARYVGVRDREDGMTESILDRVQRIVSATIEDALVLAERATGTSLLREGLREVDRAIATLERERDAATRRATEAAAQADAAQARIARLDDDARYALGRQRIDLARDAVARQVALEGEIVALASLRSGALAEAAAFDDGITDAGDRRASLARRIATLDSAEAGHSQALTPADRSIARADATFDRLASRLPPASPPLAEVAEIEALRREDAITARLAALQAKG